jgi:hypothetical protein
MTSSAIFGKDEANSIAKASPLKHLANAEVQIFKSRPYFKRESSVSIYQILLFVVKKT